MFILSAVTAFLKRAVAVATACLVFVAAGSKAQVSVWLIAQPPNTCSRLSRPAMTWLATRPRRKPPPPTMSIQASAQVIPAG